MKNTKIKLICCSACEELDIFISFAKQLLENNLSHPIPIALNNYITQIYEISKSKALPQLISLFEEHSNNLNTDVALSCQSAIKQLNTFYSQVLPHHMYESSILSDKSLLPRECFTGFIYSIEIIKKNLMQCY